jgi:hypothetical protein
MARRRPTHFFRERTKRFAFAAADKASPGAGAAIVFELGLPRRRDRLRDRHRHRIPDDFLLHREIAVAQLVAGFVRKAEVKVWEFAVE